MSNSEYMTNSVADIRPNSNAALGQIALQMTLVLDPRSHLANQYHAALCNFTQEAGQTVPGLDQGQEIVTLALHQCLLPTTVAMMSVKLVQPLPDIPVLIWHQDDVCVALSLSQLRGT